MNKTGGPCCIKRRFAKDDPGRLLRTPQLAAWYVVVAIGSASLFGKPQSAVFLCPSVACSLVASRMLPRRLKECAAAPRNESLKSLRLSKHDGRLWTHIPC